MQTNIMSSSWNGSFKDDSKIARVRFPLARSKLSNGGKDSVAIAQESERKYAFRSLPRITLFPFRPMTSKAMLRESYYITGSMAFARCSQGDIASTRLALGSHNLPKSRIQKAEQEC
jgi:hypothetical protein